MTDPSVDREVLLLRWNLGSHGVANLLDGDGAGLLGRTGWRRLRLLNELRGWRLLVLAVQVQNVRSRDILGQGIATANNVVCHGPALVRRRSILCWIVPEDGPSSRLLSTVVVLRWHIHALRLPSVLVIVRLRHWRPVALDSLVIGAVRSVGGTNVVPDVQCVVTKNMNSLLLDVRPLTGCETYLSFLIFSISTSFVINALSCRKS